eukprot:1612341-Amphidinium_carterae.1
MRTISCNQYYPPLGPEGPAFEAGEGVHEPIVKKQESSSKQVYAADEPQRDVRLDCGPMDWLKYSKQWRHIATGENTATNNDYNPSSGHG